MEGEREGKIMSRTLGARLGHASWLAIVGTAQKKHAEAEISRIRLDIGSPSPRRTRRTTIAGLYRYERPLPSGELSPASDAASAAALASSPCGSALWCTAKMWATEKNKCAASIASRCPVSPPSSSEVATGVDAACKPRLPAPWPRLLGDVGASKGTIAIEPVRAEREGARNAGGLLRT